MNEDQAVRIVEQRREQLEIDREMEFESAKRAIVAHKEDPNEPGRPEDRVAWLVTYSCDAGAVTVYVDDTRGKVLRIRRSG
jgi:phosphotransacetylase